AGCVSGIQDMGAAGITCSTSEMSGAGDSGMEIDLDKVPLREENMHAYEILLSESQERMLVVAVPGKEDTIREICERWDLYVAEIGVVTKEHKHVRYYWQGKKMADVPAHALVLGGGAPQYVRETKRPTWLDELNRFDVSDLPDPGNYAELLLRLLSRPNIADKAWVYEQYDQSVRTNTVLGPGSDAAVVRIKGTDKALAMSTDCNGRYVYLNPRRGAAIAVAEAARNVVCTGAEPVGITNCLNFGNPYKPEMYWQFAEAIAGMGEACRALKTPVTGGNVSFYNENPDGAVYPTPTIGMLGVIDDLAHITRSHFRSEGDAVVLLGNRREEVGGSEYLAAVHGKVAGECPQLDLDEEVALQRACRVAIEHQLLNSAHDLSDGGLAVALAECCIGDRENTIGAHIKLTGWQRADFALFGESQSRILVSLPQDHLDDLRHVCSEHGVPMEVLGEVGGEALTIDGLLSCPLAELEQAYYNSLPEQMAEVAEQ
ncbi:MAG TPA: phosphoribosylformylglycinamidine synthase subunit PurL, partial [Bacteroidetes bacterium]|nr:phosphoribosylformylglycinamidine synthase subunit PurL [Bacteroidota bacterium]